MESMMLGEIGVDSPLLTKLQAMQNIVSGTGFPDQQQQGAAASASHDYVCPSSSSVNQTYLHEVVNLHHTLRHDSIFLPIDSSAISTSLSTSLLPAMVDDQALINGRNQLLLCHANTTSPCLSSRQEEGGQKEASNTSYASAMAHYLSQTSFPLSSPYNTLAKHLQYSDQDDLSFLQDRLLIRNHDMQDSNTSCSVNCMVNGTSSSGHNPNNAAALSTPSTSPSSTPSSIPYNGQLAAQLAKESLQAWMAYDTSSFSGKQSALTNNINTNCASVVDAGINKKRSGIVKRSGMSADSIEQKKRRRKRRRVSHKNVEEMETQRMAHIAVERNRRKQMNEHLRTLRLLMPPSYIQRGDQASIVGGTIRFVEELEQVLQSLRLQKQLRAHQIEDYGLHARQNHELLEAPVDATYASIESCVGNVEVTILTTSTLFMKVLAQRKPHQLLDTLLIISRLSLRVTHLNITTIGLIIAYSFNLEMEKSGCQLITPCELVESIRNILCV